MATESLSEPEQLRAWIAETMRRRADFQGITILERRTADLANEIERSLRKDKALIVVLAPEAKVSGINSKTVFLEQSIIARCITGLGNKTGKSALYWACRVAANFQLERPPFDFCHSALTSPDPGLRELNIIPNRPEDDESEDYAGWDVFLEAKISLKPRN